MAIALHRLYPGASLTVAVHEAHKGRTRGECSENCGRGGLLVMVLVMMMAGLTAPITAQIPEEFTNLKVLPEDIPQRRLLTIMRGFTRALGVRCSTCHVGEEGQDLSEYDFASDDEATKRTAREMLEMVQSINENVISSLADRGTPEIEVGCVTCHAGRRRPTTLVQELTWASADGGWEARRGSLPRAAGAVLRAGYARFRPPHIGGLCDRALESRRSSWSVGRSRFEPGTPPRVGKQLGPQRPSPYALRPDRRSDRRTRAVPRAPSRESARAAGAGAPEGRRRLTA